jgi:hypothetical protein
LGTTAPYFPRRSGQISPECCSAFKPKDNSQFGGVGKYRKTPLGTTLYFSSEEELKELFGGCFDIEELRTIDIKGKNVIHRAIYALMKKKSS